jgi:dCTP deaminase
MEEEISSSMSGILTRPEIIRYLKNPFVDRVVITPLIDPEDQIRSNSIDLRLGCDFIVPRHGKVPYLDIAQEEQAFEASLEAAHGRVHVGLGEQYILHPHEFVLGGVLEYVKLPPTLAGLVIGRASWERMGVAIPTARISPGFRGCIALQLISHSDIPIALRPGMRICQLVLLPVSSPVLDDSRYDLAVYPGLTQIHRDKEIRALVQGKLRLILGITGTLVSGKSTLVECLVGQHGFLHLTLATLVHEEARRRGIPTTAASLQNVGNSIRQAHGSAILVHRLRPRMEVLPGGSYLVLEGIKNVDEVRELRKWPNFVLLAVDAPLEVRFQRAVQRARADSPATEAEFRELDERDRGINEPPWGQQVEACIAEADYTIYNDSSLEELYRRLEDVLAKVRMGV